MLQRWQANAKRLSRHSPGKSHQNGMRFLTLTISLVEAFLLTLQTNMDYYIRNTRAHNAQTFVT
jgi:hypothetical protein